MKNRVITISREFGSGGHTIGKKVAEKLGIPCYDAELIQKIAQQSGFSEAYVKEVNETRSTGFMISSYPGHYMIPSNDDILWAIQCKIITELAEQGSCVIVGRCADYVLRGKADCLNVFIHADDTFRMDRIIREYGERQETPEQRLKQKDKRRAAYYRFYTDMKWGNAKHHHLCLDSGVIGIDKCVDLIAALY